MKIDVVKLERQTEGVDKWVDNNYIGTFNYYTGVGKTFTAILGVNRLLVINPNLSTTILVPREALVSQWWERLSQSVQNVSNINIYTASEILASNIKVKTDLLIVDELHQFLGEEFFKTIDGDTHVRYTYNIGLTATYEDPEGRHHLYENSFPIIDKIDEAEAIERGFIAPYLEFNLAVPFTEKERGFYDAYTEVIKDNISKFGRNPIKLASKCLAGGEYNGVKQKGFFFCNMWAHVKGWKTDLDLSNEQHKKIDSIWNPNKIMGYASNFMTAIRKRKELLYNCESKARVTVKILEKFYGDKAIVFGQKTNYADKVALFMNEVYPNYCVVYHSNLRTRMMVNPKTGKEEKFGKVRLKKLAIESIKSGKAKAICSASSIDTGFDVPDIVLGIIGSGTQNWNQHKQRGGRVKRISDVLSKDRKKVIVNLYIKDTKDEDWLKRRQSKSDNKRYWITSVDEIVPNPVDKREFNIGVL